MKVLDLFSGVGGASVGYARAGFEVTGVDLHPQPDYPFYAHVMNVLDIKASDHIRQSYDLIHASPPCFPAGTPVLTDRGMVSIETIVTGDRVLTHLGRWRRVTATMTREADIVSDGTISCTPDHPFYARERAIKKPVRGQLNRSLKQPAWTPAREVAGRFLAVPASAETIPIPAIRGRLIDTGSEHFWYMLGRWIGDGWLRLTPRSTATSAVRKPPSRAPMTCPRCGTACPPNGRYPHLFDNYCSRACAQSLYSKTRGKPRNEIIICCSREEADDLSEKLALTGLLWTRSPQRTTVRFTASHSGLAPWIAENFGRGASQKTLPGWLFGADSKTKTSLMAGYFDADGTQRSKDVLGGTTVSVNLAYAMRVLASTSGLATFFPRVNSKGGPRIIEGRPVMTRQSWGFSVVTNGEGSEISYLSPDEGLRWVPYRQDFLPAGVTRVYDLTVDEDHSFVAWGVVVHNCQNQAAITKGTNKHRRHLHEDLYPQTKALLEEIGLPYVIENPAARPDVTLCGEQFGLGVIRHRRFELGGWSATQPKHIKHRGKVRGMRHGVNIPEDEGVYWAVYGEGGGKGTVAQWQEAMGIGWTENRKSIAEALPPSYTTWIAQQFLNWELTR